MNYPVPMARRPRILCEVGVLWRAARRRRRSRGLVQRTASLILILVLSTAHADQPYGFRVNGQGRFPNATPVTEWSPTNNVVWQTKLPNFSNSSPVLSGDRLFTCAEPTSLICLSLADGKILWQKSNDYIDVLTNPEELTKAREATSRADDANARWAAKMKERDEAEWNAYKNKNDAALKAKVQELQADVKAARKAVDQANRYILPISRVENGYTSATPVTDGKYVWASFGSGVVVCYDREGRRIWGRKIDTPADHMDWGACVSPVLAGNVLLVQYNTIFGLDAATGNELWKGKDVWKLPHDHNLELGTPVVDKIGDQYTAYTYKGAAIAARTGDEIADGLRVHSGFNSPVLQDGILYFINDKSTAFKLPRTPAAKPEKLWDGEAVSGGRFYASPLVHDGLIYIIPENGILSVLDAKTGKKVYSKKVLSGTCYCSPTLAGKYILLGSDNGKMVMIEPGREYKEVAQNELEPFRSTPVFAGSRMYVRTLKSLYCIGK